LAFLLAFGQDRFIDPCYLLVVAAFICLGAYWAGRLAIARGYPPAWGLLFDAVQAVLVSLACLSQFGGPATGKSLRINRGV
jgi:hypothetical protein